MEIKCRDKGCSVEFSKKTFEDAIFIEKFIGDIDEIDMNEEIE